MSVFTITHNATKVKAVPAGESDLEYRIAKGVSFTLVLTSISDADANARVSVRLTGQGSSATIIGILIVSGKARLSLHTMQIHEAPDTRSDLLIKTALSDEAKSFYDGGIRVEKKAQKTDAYQRNENLLLSEHAFAESKPALEILANDVRCTHGATVGPVSQEELWYLATRGISPYKAQSLIVGGFLSSALERVSDRSARQKVLTLIEDALQ